MVNVQVLEERLRDKVLSELERGRPDFDKPHTEAVVKKLKEILACHPELAVDKTVLLIAAYAHDWGYADLFKNGKPVQYQEVKDAKESHMEIGASKLKKLLSENVFGFLTDSQRRRAVHLVRLHDKLEELKGFDELILMEADTLGAADPTLVKPTFDYESNQKWVKEVRGKRLPKFITDYSKKEIERLIKLRTEYYKKKG